MNDAEHRRVEVFRLVHLALIAGVWNGKGGRSSHPGVGPVGQHSGVARPTDPIFRSFVSESFQGGGVSVQYSTRVRAFEIAVDILMNSWTWTADMQPQGPTETLF